VLLAITEQRNVLKLFAETLGEIKMRQEHSGFVGVQRIHSVPRPSCSNREVAYDKSRVKSSHFLPPCSLR
jgi:hypothetical protein